MQSRGVEILEGTAQKMTLRCNRCGHVFERTSPTPNFWFCPSRGCNMTLTLTPKVLG